LTVSAFCVATAVAVPDVTSWAGPFVPQAPAAQGTGSAGGAAKDPDHAQDAPIASSASRGIEETRLRIPIINLINQ
jgi:hypothetical protein